MPHNPDNNPAVVYRESLLPGSYWAVRHSLETVAAVVAGEVTDPWTFPWWELRYRDTAKVRAALINRFAPSTVNRTLSALRTVLKHAWRLGLMDAETYRRAVDVENVRASTLPSGRAVEKDELRALFAVCAADRSPAGRRDAAILAVLYGGRVFFVSMPGSERRTLSSGWRSPDKHSSSTGTGFKLSGRATKHRAPGSVSTAPS